MKTNKFILAAFAALALGACSNDNETEPHSSFPADGKVRITAGINDIDTRAGIDKNNITSRNIGFFFTTPENVKYSYGNVKLSYSSEWTAAQDMYWLDKTTPVTVVAYSPWQDGATLTAPLTYETPDTQSGPDDIEAADWVYQTRQVNPSMTDAKRGLTSDGKIRLSLRHIFSKIQLSLSLGTDITEEAPDARITSVLIKGLKKKGTIKLKNGLAEALADDNTTVDIIPCNTTDMEYEAIFLPQMVDAGQFSVEITVNNMSDSRTYTYTLGREHTFANNTLYKLPIKVGTSTPQVNFAASGIDSESWGDPTPLGDKITD